MHSVKINPELKCFNIAAQQKNINAFLESSPKESFYCNYFLNSFILFFKELKCLKFVLWIVKRHKQISINSPILWAGHGRIMFYLLWILVGLTLLTNQYQRVEVNQHFTSVHDTGTSCSCWPTASIRSQWFKI